MNARTKLNIANANGCLLIAGLIGLVTESWWLFFAALVGLVLLNLCMGGIRPDRQSS